MSDTPSTRAVAVPSVPGLLGVTRPRPPRSEVARVVLGTLGNTGAIVGVSWLGLVSFLAIFAPFLASSFPLAVKIKGQGWSSPLLARLAPIDGLLPLGALLALALFFLKRWNWKTRLVTWIVIMVIATPLAMRLMKQPERAVYDTYRSLARQGQVEKVHHALIPFSPSDRLGDDFDPLQPHPRAPSSEHWMGTELNGGDIASKMIHACRIAMSVGFISTGIALVVGVMIGGMMGYFSGIVDLLGMRLVEIFDAIPRTYLLLAILAFWRDERIVLYLIMIIIGLTGWSGYALFVRAEFLKLRQQDFVLAAKACGLPLRSVLFKHMLPNGVTPVLVSASFGIAGAINVENTLSFLGVGLVEQPSWGQLIGQATFGGVFHWWLAVYPGLALSLTIFAYILIGEAVRDVIDPHSQRSSQL